ncbi:hypothetical protein K501DRAFT_327939 [Backusella circina FSU 941]|nr:hypothetical protein K501DRAFT_327939 [Backusella circina FSU 941]
MDNNEELKHLLEGLHSQALSLIDPETLNRLKKAKEKRRETKEAEESYLQAQREENKKSQAELDELREERKELEAQLTAREKAEAHRKEACRVGQEKVEALEEEYRALLEEVKDTKDSIESYDGTAGDMLKARKKPKQLELALYQGLGVTIQIDEKDRAIAACITSLADQKTRLLPLNTNEPLLPTVDRIWDLISKE